MQPTFGELAVYLPLSHFGQAKSFNLLKILRTFHPHHSHYIFVDANIFFGVLALLASCTLIIFFRPSYLRMRAEQEAAAQRILGFNSSNGSPVDT